MSDNTQTQTVGEQMLAKMDAVCNSLKSIQEEKTTQTQESVKSLEVEVKSLKNTLEVLEAKNNKPAIVGGATAVPMDYATIQSKSLNIFMKNAGNEDSYKSLESNAEYRGLVTDLLQAHVKEMPNSIYADMVREVKSIDSLSSSLGGFFRGLPVQLEIERQLRSQSPIRSLATVIGSRGSRDIKFPQINSYGQGLFAKENETQYDKTTSPMRIKEGKRTALEVYQAIEIHENVMQGGNVRELLNLISTVATENIAHTQNKAFLFGHSVAGVEIDGLIPSDDKKMYLAKNSDSYEYGKVGYVETAVAGKISYQDIHMLIVKTFGMIRPGSVLAGNANTFGILSAMGDEHGRPIFLPENNVPFATSSFRGIPFIIDNEIPDIESGKIALLYGNIGRAYTIYDAIAAESFLREPTSSDKVSIFISRIFSAGILKNFQSHRLLKIK